MDRLLQQLVAHPNLHAAEEQAIIEKLAAYPLVSAEAIALLLGAGWRSVAHPKDVVEALVRALSGIYSADARAVERLLADQSMAGIHELVVCAIQHSATKAPWVQL